MIKLVWTKTGRERWKEIQQNKGKLKNRKRALNRYHRKRGITQYRGISRIEKGEWC